MRNLIHLLRTSDPAGGERIDLDARAEDELAALLGSRTAASARPRATGTRRRSALVTGFVAIALVSATIVVLASVHPSAVRPNPAESTAALSGSAIDLTRRVWRVEGAAGESDRTWLRFDVGSIDVIRPDNSVYFAWSVQGYEIVTMPSGFTMHHDEDPTVSWLARTTAFHRTDDGWQLLDAGGRLTARLVVRGTPPRSSRSSTTVPADTARLRSALTDATYGSGVIGIDPDVVVGRWRLPGVSPSDASVTFSAAGSWRSTTACPGPIGVEGGSGSFRALADGGLLFTESYSNLMVCQQQGTAPATAIRTFTELSSARSIRIDGDTATLFDRSGNSIGTLERIAP